MARRKLSEYRSKQMVSKALGLQYSGWGVNIDTGNDLHKQLSAITEASAYVLKVDQGVKGRFKKGLVLLDVRRDALKTELKKLAEKGYTSFIIEPQITHDANEEKYIALSYERGGTIISFSDKGGVDIESNTSTIQTHLVTRDMNWEPICNETFFTEQQLIKITELFELEFITMLEINPYIVQDGTVKVLDAAIEVDDAGSYFATQWNEDDFRQSSSRYLTDEERIVQELDAQSPASIKLEVINPNGAVFLLLSGGGASVVVADEVYNLGLGDQLANYGEYSGNPNAEETYIYTKSVLQLLLASSAPKKVMFIGGAVANFTDIASTFTGLIKAINELSDQLMQQKVKVFVRRGGPRQEIGLANIRKTLEAHDLLGAVYDATVPLTKVVAEAMKEIN